VSAKDVRTGQEHSIEVQPSYGLSDAEIERMLEESIENAERDFTERQVIEARTEAEAILGATSKALASNQGKTISAGERAKIDAATAGLKEAVAGTDYKLMRKRIDELNQVTLRLAETIMDSAVSSVLQGRNVAEI
jgi:molecular chaperone DnaK